MTQDEIRLHDLQDEHAEMMTRLLHLDQFLFEYRGGLEYEEKRLLRVQRTIMYSYVTVLGERCQVLKDEIEKDKQNDNR